LAETVGYTIEEHVATDGYRWRYRRYRPTGAARAEVACLHGIRSHGGWYEYSSSRLRDAGFAVSFLDRRGAGLNKQDWGYVPSFRRMIDDVAEYLKTLPRPVILVAMSWGGKVATALQRRHPGLVDGLALLCPGYFPQVRTPFTRRVAIFCANWLAPRRLFPVPLNEPELFTANPRWLKYLHEDPLSLHEATARLLYASARLTPYLSLVPRWVRVPVLLMLGEKDLIIDNTRTRRYLDRFATTDKQVIEYPGAHHTLEFEPEPDRFIGDLCEWIGRMCIHPRDGVHQRIF
jgi:alpha-beta hydrolase superfamily lysophospholipase